MTSAIVVTALTLLTEVSVYAFEASFNEAEAAAFEFQKNIAMLLGHFATICFTLQYIPQAIKNYRRQSVKGFSTTGIIIKLVGAAFLAVNATILGESAPVVLYGFFNVIQHSIFVVQFAIYTKQLCFLPWIMFPLLPFWMGIAYPETIRMFVFSGLLCHSNELYRKAFTNSVKPVAQVLSHFPQLWLCVNMKSISGVSMLTQHLNVFGGVTGLLMTTIIKPKTYATYLIYLNSCFQALSLYAVGLLYEGWPSLQLNLKTFLTFGLSESSSPAKVENPREENTHSL